MPSKGNRLTSLSEFVIVQALENQLRLRELPDHAELPFKLRNACLTNSGAGLFGVSLSRHEIGSRFFPFDRCSRHVHPVLREGQLPLSGVECGAGRGHLIVIETSQHQSGLRGLTGQRKAALLCTDGGLVHLLLSRRHAGAGFIQRGLSHLLLDQSACFQRLVVAVLGKVEFSLRYVEGRVSRSNLIVLHMV